MGVAGDEALRQHDAADRGEAFLQRLVGREIATRRNEARPLGLVAQRRAFQVVADVEPSDLEPGRAQIRGTELGRGELAVRKHACVHTGAHLANELDAGDDLRQRAESLVEHLGVDLEVACEGVMLSADLAELLVGVAAGDSGVQQRDQRVGDPDQCRMDDDRANALLEPFTNEARDDRPILRRGDAAAAELQNDPGRLGIRGIGGLARAEHWL